MSAVTRLTAKRLESFERTKRFGEDWSSFQVFFSFFA